MSSIYNHSTLSRLIAAAALALGLSACGDPVIGDWSSEEAYLSVFDDLSGTVEADDDVYFIDMIPRKDGRYRMVVEGEGSVECRLRDDVLTCTNSDDEAIRFERAD